MKQFRLIVHQTTFSKEDLLINPKDYPGAKEGDVVEIFHSQDEDNPRLLLQINAFKDDLQTRDTISVEQSIALTFGLQTYKNVSMRVVAPSEVALDSVELTFKDQYMGRSEMWRLKNSLTNTCVYTNKKLEFCGGAVRCQVYEMWSQGDRVACGVITDDTKVVFRSSTSMVYLFLQMSSEMWDFDIHGDLYFEKAVNGFLADLFMKWKKNGSNHEVTIVLFSRTFYEASSLEEFPIHMRECLQIDYRGRYYEDFYRVAVQNERLDDWSQILVQLRHLFSRYLKIVLEYHTRSGQIIPAATNSTAAQGNFLEVLNMSLNVFEKHYLDRSFERTGQLSVVVTPGVGVFEVDRELTNVTKQRIIDNGVGSDLVCVGEQPLHAVPLLKFHNKDSQINAADDYSMPHWINLSFYSSNKKIPYSNFVPRIKLPPPHPTSRKHGQEVLKTKLLSDDEYIHNSFFDYDAYDAQVFQLPAAHGTSSLQRMMSRGGKRTPTAMMDLMEDSRGLRRKMSDPDIHHMSDGTPRSQVIVIPPAPHTAMGSPIVSPSVGTSEGHYMKARAWTTEALDTELSPPLRVVIGSAGSPPTPGCCSSAIRPSRALINPFDPSHVTIKLTSNRRRWTHIFPKGPTGVLIQQHHYQAVPTQPEYSADPSSDFQGIQQNVVHPLTRTPSQIALQEYCRKQKVTSHGFSSQSSTAQHNYVPKSSTLLWGATGEMEWTPALTTGVDWKSLTIPACLPITTDYFPDKRALQNDYVVSQYTLLPDDVNADFAQQRAIYKKPLTTPKVFKELVSQRLAQGFQLILLAPSNDSQNSSGKGTPTSSASLVRKRTAEMESTEQYLLSIGRVFHKISLSGNAITVTMYRPRHPYPPFNIQYRYRFHAPHHDTYEVSWVSFTTEKLETYNWNYLDHYICTRGDTDFVLVEALKFWRFRVYLLPYANAATKRINEGCSNCDLYEPQKGAEHTAMLDGFLKFTETVVNKIKRPNSSKKSRMSLNVVGPLLPLPPRRYSMSSVSQGNVVGNSPFRERLGSNRLPDRPMRPRSGSKVERGRVSPATASDISQPPDSQNYDSNNEDGLSNNEPTLPANCTYTDILEAMRHPITGVGFLMTHPSLPSQTFVSADAVHWLKVHVDGICSNERAMQILQTMLTDKLICHASGDFSKPVIFGFYLYYIIPHEKEDKEYFQPLGDLQSFENEWLEVEVQSPRCPEPGETSSIFNFPTVNAEKEIPIPHFLSDPKDSNSLLGDCYTDFPLYKHIHLETDVLGKSDRVEWGHCRYQTVFRPDQAYELIVEWLTSSGSIVAELLFGWTRKAQACGLLMVPIPHDPLALPFSNKSDPLRGPIFVPLDIECLLKNKTYLFEEFREDTRADRLFLFQEAIVTRFGFISCLVEPTTSGTNSQVSQDHQYIHCTGTVFILIPGPSPRRHRLTSVNQRRTGQTSGRYPVHIDVVPSPHEAYITRHVSGKNKDDYENSRRNGFLWSWNHMVSRRWKPNTAQDNTFQIKLFKDFRSFCANHNERLRQFWDQCWKAKEDSCTKSSI